MVSCWTCGRTFWTWRLRERNFCSGKCRVRHHRSRSYTRPGRSNIADDANNGVDGTSRIKAAVMVTYLSGRPAPTVPADGISYALLGFRQLQQEFGIQLTDEGS